MPAPKAERTAETARLTRENHGAMRAVFPFRKVAMTIAALKAARAQAIDAAKAITAKAKADKNRDLTDEEAESVQGHVDKANEIKAQIAKAERNAELLAQVDADAVEINAQPRTRTLGGAAQPDELGTTAVRDLAQDDPNRGFKSPREFFNAVMRAGLSRGQAVDARLKPLAAVGSDEQQGGQDIYGGFLIPQGFSPNLLSVANEVDPTAGRTTSLPMGSPIVNIPARTDKNHTSSVTGGLTFTRRSETAEGTASRMAMEQVSLRANSLMGLNYTTEELMNDSAISVAALLAAGFREEYAATMINEKLFGTGAGQYLGVVGAPGTVSQAKETGQAALTIVAENITKMRSRCWGYASAIWIANHDTFPQLAKLKLDVGTGGVALYQPSLVEDRPDMLLGRPIFYSEFAATLGTVGDLVLGNWSQYLEGTLGSPTPDLQESIHVRFTTNERAFRATVRNDGQPWWRSALTPKKSSVTLSPFVTLNTRA